MFPENPTRPKLEFLIDEELWELRRITFGESPDISLIKKTDYLYHKLPFSLQEKFQKQGDANLYL